MKNFSLILLLSAFCFTTSCKQENKSTNPETSIATSADSGENTSDTNYSGDYVISDKSGKVIGAFSTGSLSIQAEGKKYTFKEKAEKRKYYTNGNLTYEVKHDADGFKLRDSSSKLLWKVKFYPDKIKISDNEENTNPFETKNKNGKIEVSKNGAIAYNVEIAGNELKTDGKKAFSFSQPLENYSSAILAIKEIPVDQRVFLLAEYLYQTK